MYTNPKTGLTNEEYSKQVSIFGLNTLPEVKPPRKLEILLGQFRNPLIYILAAAGVLTLVLGDIPESIGILAVVIVNGVLGFIQENKAENTLSALQSTLKPHSQVIRNGIEQNILTSDLTVGDIVILKLGDKVPADGILLNGNDFSVNEAVLTGESEPIPKIEYTDLKEIEVIDDKHILFMGSSVMSGYGKMVVTTIGVRSKFGQIAQSISTQERTLTPLQQRIKNFSSTLTIIVVVISLFMFTYGFARGLEVKEILELTISVAVSTIPEGLIVALTVILALGMNRILRRRAVVRKLVAAETLGSVDVICIDKTGTLTEGKMRVIETMFNDPDIALRAVRATNRNLNAVDIALHNWIETQLSAKQRLETTQEKYLDFKVFNSQDKFTATLGSENIYVLGAPELLLEHSILRKEERVEWLKRITKLSHEGMRLVGVAYRQHDQRTTKLPKDIPSNLTWLGLVSIEDPIRPHLLTTFQQAEAAGMKVKVITGDYGATAMTVLKRIGIEIEDSETLSGPELNEISDQQLLARITQIRLFYRTTPDQKLRIVSALQAAGHVVAMMGDGINDSPALKRAEIGIVVDNATDFSKEIADIVLLDSNFQTIIAAVEEGRGIFENMRKVITYLLVDSFDALVLVLGSLLLNLPSPLLPLQILYINFLADGLPDIALAFEKPEHEVMKDKPKPKNYPLLDAEVRSMILTIGLVVCLAILIIYSFMYSRGMDVELLRTLVFALLGLNSLIYVFSIRSFRHTIFSKNIVANKLLLGGVGFGILSIVFAIYSPLLQPILETVALPGWAWLIVLGNTMLNIILIEAIKYRFNQKRLAGNIH